MDRIVERNMTPIFVFIVLWYVFRSSSPVLLSSRVCGLRSSSFHQADHADSAKLGDGEVNNRVSGGVVQDFLTRI